MSQIGRRRVFGLIGDCAVALTDVDGDYEVGLGIEIGIDVLTGGHNYGATLPFATNAAWVIGHPAINANSHALAAMSISQSG